MSMRLESKFGGFGYARRSALVLLALVGCSSSPAHHSSDGAVGPSISAQPAAITVAAGSAASFAVTSSGDGLRYQWLRDGAAISGAIGATYTTASTVAADDGAVFTVNVSDAVGQVTSAPATLHVDWVRIDTQPHSAVVELDYGVTLIVEAVGNGTLAYQWRKDGKNVDGATSASLPLAHIKVDDAGTYDCVVSGQLDSVTVQVTSAPATIQTNAVPTITSQPASLTVAAGSNAAFSVAATTSGGTLSYQWRKNGTPIPTAIGGTLNLTTVAPGDAGAYDCVVTSTLVGNTTVAISNAANLVVVVPPNAPVVTIAAQVTAGKTGLVASTQDQGAGPYTWTLTNGTITSGQGTRSITYTAGAAGRLVASVQLSNLAGSPIGYGSETVIALVPTPALLCPSTVHPNDTWMQATFSANPGYPYSWSIVPGAATGTITSGQGKTTIRFSAGSTTGSFSVQVSATNALGDPSTAMCTVNVQNGVWVVEDGGPMNAIGAQPAVAVLPNGSVLVSGGHVGSKAVATSMIYSPATGTWFATAPMNTPRYGHTATVLPDGTVLVAGGTGPSGANVSSAEIFDPIAGAWTTLTSTMSAARGTHTATLLSAQGKVLLAGGGTSSSNAISSADLYDPVAKTFTATGAMKITRFRHTATLLQSGQVLIAGGQGGTGAATTATNAQSTLEIYDPTAGTFTLVTSLLQKPRFFHGASLLNNGTVLITGGGSSSGTAEIFDPSTGPAAATTTLTANNLAVGRGEHSSTTLLDGRVLLVGGLAGITPPLPEMTAEIYDPRNGSFTQTGVMQNGRYLHGAALLPNGRVIVAGGSADNITSTNSVELYDPSLGSWSFPGGQMIGRQMHTTTVLADGRVLVAGGLGGGSGSAQYMTSAQIYDPSTRTWSSTGSLTKGRYDHTATLLNDGRVLVTGGVIAKNAAGASATTNSAEIWNPSGPNQGTWTAAASMTGNPNGRRSHVATLLPSGNVLVTGGQDLSSPRNFLASAEIYDPVQDAWSSPSPTPPPAPSPSPSPLPLPWPPQTMSVGRYYHTATLVGGKVVIIGGNTGTNAGGVSGSSTLTSSVDVFDPATQSFTPLTDIGGAGPTPRGNHTATPLANGKIFVAGGTILGGLFGTTTANTTELYDPSTGVSAPSPPPMSVARVQHTAVLLPNGKVLLTGGGGSPAITASEIYDPNTASITPTGSLNVGRYNTSAVLLCAPSPTQCSIGDGSVMVTGGNVADANTEIYLP
jgi:hypothetical protein